MTRKLKDDSLVGKMFWFIGDRGESYPLYQGKIIRESKEEVVGLVVNQSKSASKEEIEVRVDKKRIHFIS